MTTIPQNYLHTIRRTYPDASATQLQLNQEGLVNDIVIVDGERVFRFPKHVWAKDLLQHEARVLDLVRSHIRVAVPRFETLDEDAASYRYLSGVPLTRTLLLRQPPPVRAALLSDVLGFVQDLHAVPMDAATEAGIGPSDTNRDRSWWLTLHHDLQEHLFPLLMRHQRAFVADLFAPVLSGELDLGYESRLVHGDLAPYHLLVDPARGRLTGVLDFGTAGLGDPAVDVACLLYAFGESLVVPRLASTGRNGALLNRARFWAAMLDLEHALLGLQRDSKEFLVAHVGGGARDLQPFGRPAGVGK